MNEMHLLFTTIHNFCYEILCMCQSLATHMKYKVCMSLQFTIVCFVAVVITMVFGVYIVCMSVLLAITPSVCLSDHLYIQTFSLSLKIFVLIFVQYPFSSPSIVVVNDLAAVFRLLSLLLSVVEDTNNILWYFTLFILVFSQGFRCYLLKAVVGVEPSTVDKMHIMSINVCF